MEQLLKSADLLRESGEIVVDSWLLLDLMLNLQEGHNEFESVRDVSRLNKKRLFLSNNS